MKKDPPQVLAPEQAQADLRTIGKRADPDGWVAEGYLVKVGDRYRIADLARELPMRISAWITECEPGGFVRIRGIG